MKTARINLIDSFCVWSGPSIPAERRWVLFSTPVPAEPTVTLHEDRFIIT